MSPKQAAVAAGRDRDRSRETDTRGDRCEDPDGDVKNAVENGTEVKNRCAHWCFARWQGQCGRRGGLKHKGTRHADADREIGACGALHED